MGKPKKTTKQIKPPDYKFHEQKKWSSWVRKNIATIEKEPVPEGIDNITRYLKGTHYRYRLEFPVVGEWVTRRLGTPTVYQRPRTWYWNSKPQWERISPTPAWIDKKIHHIGDTIETNNYYLDEPWYFKGKRYRYKVVPKGVMDGAVKYVITYKKPRTWYWKKLNG